MTTKRCKTPPKVQRHKTTIKETQDNHEEIQNDQKRRSWLRKEKKTTTERCKTNTKGQKITTKGLKRTSEKMQNIRHKTTVKETQDNHTERHK